MGGAGHHHGSWWQVGLLLTDCDADSSTQRWPVRPPGARRRRRAVAAAGDRGRTPPVCAVLANPDRRTTTTPVARWLMSGIGRCGECGDTLTTGSARSRGVTTRTYMCASGKPHGARKADRVDEYVADVLVARLAEPDALALLEYACPGHCPAAGRERGSDGSRGPGARRLHGRPAVRLRDARGAGPSRFAATRHRGSTGAGVHGSYDDGPADEP